MNKLSFQIDGMWILKLYESAYAKAPSDRCGFCGLVDKMDWLSLQESISFQFITIPFFYNNSLV